MERSSGRRPCRRGASNINENGGRKINKNELISEKNRQNLTPFWLSSPSCTEVRTTAANSLYEMDKATQEVVNAIVEAQSCCPGLAMNKISVGSNLPTVNLQRSVGLPELRGLRRTFIKRTEQYSLSGPPPPTDADSAKRMFVDYLNREIGA